MTKSKNFSPKNDHYIAFIPCAGNPPIEMQAEFGPTPTAFLPLGKSIALVELLTRIENHFDHIYVGLKQIPPSVEILITKQFPNVHLIAISNSHSIGETLLKLIKMSDLDQHSKIYVQLGDSLQQFTPPQRTTFYYSLSSHPYKWISFDLLNNKVIDKIVPPTNEHSEAHKRIFSGQFFFTDHQSFIHSLKKHTSSEKSEIDPFFKACKDISENSDIDFLAKDISEWSDFGYLASYHSSKKQITMNAREFNSLEFDRKKNTITKRSKNTTKFLGEIRWFKNIPAELAYLHPRIYSVNDLIESPSIEMEYLPATPLDQLYLYTSTDLFTWKKITSHVLSAIKEMHHFSSSAYDVNELCRDMYINKTLERINEYIYREQFSTFRQDSIQINGNNLSGLDTVVNTLENYVNRHLITTANAAQIIHGDLCFSNILYDLRSDQIKLIDPRGSFGAQGVYGDARYDLAKLRHSAISQYDFLVNGLFHLSLSDLNVELQIHRTKRQEQISKYFEDLLQGLSVERYAEIILIESLLFLSMVPLHNDRPQSQNAYIATGLMLFNQFLKEVTEL